MVVVAAAIAARVGKTHLQWVRYIWKEPIDAAYRHNVRSAKEISHTELVLHNSKGNRGEKGQKWNTIYPIYSIGQDFYWSVEAGQKSAQWIPRIKCELSTLVIGCIKTRANARKWLEYMWHWPLSYKIASTLTAAYCKKEEEDSCNGDGKLRCPFFFFLLFFELYVCNNQ